MRSIILCEGSTDYVLIQYFLRKAYNWEDYVFVDAVDAKKRYLNKRRYITKAKFDVYFSIRTPAGQFVERQNVLKGIEWEKYTDIQKCFKKLGDLADI